MTRLRGWELGEHPRANEYASKPLRDLLCNIIRGKDAVVEGLKDACDLSHQEFFVIRRTSKSIADRSGNVGICEIELFILKPLRRVVLWENLVPAAAPLAIVSEIHCRSIARFHVNALC